MQIRNFFWLAFKRVTYLIYYVQALEMTLEKISARVYSYVPFRFQPVIGPKGPLLKVVTECEGAIIEPLTKEVS